MNRSGIKNTKDGLLLKIRENTIRRLQTKGIEIDNDIYQKALSKAKRWMKSAYGSLNYGEYLQECTDVSYYYLECLDEPTGINTFNNETKRNNQKRKRMRL